MFVPEKHFQTYLLFEIKAVTETSLSGALLSFNLLANPKTLDSAWKALQGQTL
jgi:hypothetical protein